MVRIRGITQVVVTIITAEDQDFPEQVEAKEEVQAEEWAAEEVEAWVEVAEWDTDQAVNVYVRHAEPWYRINPESLVINRYALIVAVK